MVIFLHFNMKLNTFLVFVFIYLNWQGVICDSCYESGLGTGERTYTCETDVKNFKAKTKVDIKTCRNDPLIKFRFEIPELRIDYETQLHASQDIEIPGLSLSALAGLYMQVNLEDDHSGNIKLKVLLLVKIFGSTPLKITLLEETITDSDCNNFLKLWNSADDSIKYGAIGGMVLLLGLFVLCCYCCCCKKSRSSSAIIMSANTLPMFESKVPYKIHKNV
ncbi:uncharacterized protein LOC124811129 isoform X1 [Hydra vulgaris]|uniref:uncharacterized protein LOC124811129 isoform X1 n=1 Tax=Hydra vulgaris TaxID=6087 RepID=UPI0001924B85|nr:uncharacterized protein LOC124811129 isoform X1 [Hydra vulgaris]